MKSVFRLKSAIAAALLSGAALAAQTAPTLWLSTGLNQLATVDVANGNTTVIGLTIPFMADIAFSPTGALYGISFSQLYSIDKTNANTTLIGNLGGVSGTANALVFGADGTLYMAGSTLYTLNISTGAATAVGLGIGKQSGGDLAFIGTTLYMAASDNDLVAVNTVTGVGTVVGAMGVGNMFGLATPDNATLYGMSGQSVYTINTVTGAAALVSTFAPSLGFAAGSAFETESGAVPVAPTLSLTLLALAAAFAARRRTPVAA